MAQPLQSLIAAGSKLWLDSVDPDEVTRNREWGATGATSNPIIISDLIKTGRLDEEMSALFRQGLPDDEVAWSLTDRLVSQAQEVFLPVWKQTRGDDGYVSFELDPLLEDVAESRTDDWRSEHYVALAKRWSKDRPNRMIKIPATPGGLGALEQISAAGISVNVTLTFSPRQYVAARDALWRGAQRSGKLGQFKSVYSIFVSRVDVYAEKHVPELSERAQGLVGIVNAKRIWRMNEEFWADKDLPLRQEIVFASTGTKRPQDPPWKYVEAFAGSGIETNPPETNLKVQESGRTITRQIDLLPPREVLDEIDAKVDMGHMEATLMEEGLKKFSDPQSKLLALIAEKRASSR